MKLIVIIRDVAPVIVLQEPVGLRRVEIKLTPEQMDALELRETGTSMGQPIREQYSFCFLEDK
jgi:hypothetical protein